MKDYCHTVLHRPLFGSVFAVGKVRVLETLLMEPRRLETAFAAADFHAAGAVVKSGPFGRLVDEAKDDFGMGAYISSAAALFSHLAGGAAFFTADEREFLAFLERNGRKDILDALRDHPAPLDFYAFIDGRRKELAGRIGGVEVLERVWLALWWQAKIVRMILMAKKRGVDFKHVA